MSRVLRHRNCHNTADVTLAEKIKERLVKIFAYLGHRGAERKSARIVVTDELREFCANVVGEATWLVKVNVYLNSVFCTALNKSVKDSSSLFISLRALGNEGVGRKVCKKSVKPNAVNSLTLVFFKKCVGKVLFTVNKESVSARRYVAVNKARSAA